MRDCYFRCLNLSQMSFMTRHRNIYIFCIIAHTSSSPDGNTDLQFFIDSQLVGKYRLQPTGSTIYDYNVPVYVNESLSNGPHNLTIQNGRIGGLFSLILLDKIMYRYVVSILGSTGLHKSRAFADRSQFEVRMMARLYQAPSVLYRPQALSLRSL